MAAVLNVLRDLHRIHQQLTDLRERLERCPRLLKAAQKQVDDAHQLLTDQKAETQTFQLAAKEQELVLEERAAKILNRQARLKECASNKEYQMLKDEIQSDEAANSELSDKILLAYEAIDQQQEQAQSLAEEVARVEQEQQKTAEQVAEREAVLNTDLERIQAELQNAEAELPSEFVGEYRRISAAKGEDAFGHVSDKYCGTCSRQITAQMNNDVLTGKLTICGSCGAILYPKE